MSKKSPRGVAEDPDLRQRYLRHSSQARCFGALLDGELLMVSDAMTKGPAIAAGDITRGTDAGRRRECGTRVFVFEVGAARQPRKVSGAARKGPNATKQSHIQVDLVLDQSVTRRETFGEDWICRG